MIIVRKFGKIRRVHVILTAPNPSANIAIIYAKGIEAFVLKAGFSFVNRMKEEFYGVGK